MTLGAFEEKFPGAKDRVGAAAGFDLPGNSRGRVRLGQKIHPQRGRRRTWRFPRRPRVFALAIRPATLLPIPRSSAARTIPARTPWASRPRPTWRAVRARSRSAAILVATGRRAATTGRTRAPAVVARSAVVAEPRTVVRFALVIGVPIRRRGFFYPIGQEFQV